MLGISLGAVMEKYYKSNGRDATGDELVSLAHCLAAEGQKAQTKCAQATGKNYAIRKWRALNLKTSWPKAEKENSALRMKWRSCGNRWVDGASESASRPHVMLA